MIDDIFFSWNELTITTVVWLACVSTAVAVDFVPEIYREKKARARLEETMKMVAERKITNPQSNPDETMQLGVFNLTPVPVKRRHAKV